MLSFVSTERLHHPSYGPGEEGEGVQRGGGHFRHEEQGYLQFITLPPVLSADVPTSLPGPKCPARTNRPRYGEIDMADGGRGGKCRRDRNTHSLHEKNLG